MKLRFGRRKIVTVVAMVAIAMCAAPAALNWCYWRGVQWVVSNTMADLAVTAESTVQPAEPSVFAGFISQNEYYLSNHEIKWDASLNGMTESNPNRRRDAVFVSFPSKAGSWANSSDEIVQLLKRESSLVQSTN